MKTLEVRRHTMRRKPGAHLSQDGIALARLVGGTAGPFSLVVTSTIPRAIETAIAMGFEVHETLDALGNTPREVEDEVSWPSPLAAYAQAFGRGGHAARYARAQAALWRSVAERLGEGQQALIISHGSIVELGAVASVPRADHAAWGGALGYCEGVRLTYAGGDCSGAILRVPAEYHLVAN